MEYRESIDRKSQHILTRLETARASGGSPFAGKAAQQDVRRDKLRNIKKIKAKPLRASGRSPDEMVRSKGVTSSKQEDHSKSKIKVLPMRFTRCRQPKPVETRRCNLGYHFTSCDAVTRRRSSSNFSIGTLQRIQKSCSFVKSVGREFNAVARFLVLHQRIVYKTLN